MEKFVIEGGKPLRGTLRIQGAKNAALPILAATVLAGGNHVIRDVPRLLDIKVMTEILKKLGAMVNLEGSDCIVDSRSIHTPVVPDDLMGKMRSSIFLMGPLLARFGEVTVSKPGGCAIGERKINLHLKGLQALGAEIREENEFLYCRADRLYGASIHLDYPSVGATENIMMAATKANGETVIYNAAKEPEIVDLQNFLNSMGARIKGAGSDAIVIEGVCSLQETNYRIIPDRVVAGTMMLATAITGGETTLENVVPFHLRAAIDAARQTGVQVNAFRDIMEIKGIERPRKIEKIRTAPYPGFPTDLQALFMAYLARAEGVSIISEEVFEGRFKHVNELNRMGASIRVDLNSAFIEGVPRLTGAHVEATDLRAGAALVIAGLAAEGTTTIEKIHHIDRGYERLEKQMAQLGADMRRVNLD